MNFQGAEIFRLPSKRDRGCGKEKEKQRICKHYMYMDMYILIMVCNNKKDYGNGCFSDLYTYCYNE